MLKWQDAAVYEWILKIMKSKMVREREFWVIAPAAAVESF